MSLYIHKSHNVTVLLYHLVFPAKYRRAVFDAAVDQVLRDVWLGIEARYQLKVLEIGADRDHVHVLVQSAPTYSVTKLVTTIKSLTAREIVRRCPQVKKELWGGDFWTDGSCASTVGRNANEAMISDYVKKQGQEYQKLHERFCQVSRQPVSPELGWANPGSCGLQDGQHGCGPSEEKQSPAVGGHMLMVAGARAEEVTEFIVSPTEPGGRS